MRSLQILIILLLFVSCRNNGHENEEILARVYDKYLYSSELDKLIPPGTHAKDSLMLAKNFINNWVRQNLVIQQAEQNLTEEQKDFERQLETYRNSLIIYQYERLLIEQKLDTVVTEEQVADYYDKNPENFELRENLLIANYIVLESDARESRELAKLIQSDEAEDYEKIRQVCDSLGLECYLNNEKWISFTELNMHIPVNTLDEENFIRNKKFTEIKEEPYLYLLRIRDFRIKGDTAPLSYASDDIRRVILNKRKTMLIKQMEEEMFNSALEKNEIDIY
ncbi:MAG: hypothetical protein U5Q03_09040 [Bacteroidota bacterium]|nr:hypothetical protein [Bacteroidota bacterium]